MDFIVNFVNEDIEVPSCPEIPFNYRQNDITPKHIQNPPLNFETKWNYLIHKNGFSRNVCIHIYLVEVGEPFYYRNTYRDYQIQESMWTYGALIADEFTIMKNVFNRIPHSVYGHVTMYNNTLGQSHAYPPFTFSKFSKYIRDTISLYPPIIEMGYPKGPAVQYKIKTNLPEIYSFLIREYSDYLRGQDAKI